MFKIVTLFLVFIAVIAMFGKLHWLGVKKIPGKCAKCGRYKIGRGGCDLCGKDN
ncbi:MAG: hypothetical protein AAFY38_12510 [Pseudomonadota bacterium]